MTKTEQAWAGTVCKERPFHDIVAPPNEVKRRLIFATTLDEVFEKPGAVPMTHTQESRSFSFVLSFPDNLSSIIIPEDSCFTVFVQGLASFREQWFLYFGMGDSGIGVAVLIPEGNASS
jgi:hypothetical protein